MSAWLTAAGALLPGLGLCARVCLRGDPLDRLVGLEMAGVLLALALMILAAGTHRPGFLDAALMLALLSFGGGLVFARFLERWL